MGGLGLRQDPSGRCLALLGHAAGGKVQQDLEAIRPAGLMQPSVRASQRLGLRHRIFHPHGRRLRPLGGNRVAIRTDQGRRLGGATWHAFMWPRDMCQSTGFDSCPCRPTSEARG